MGPPSSGGSTVGEALNILEGYDLSPRPTHRPSTSASALHLFLESSRFSFADRNAYLADPEFFDVPLAGLLSDSFAAERPPIHPRLAATPARSRPGDPNVTTRATEPRRRHVEPSLGPHQSRPTLTDPKGTVVSYTFTIESTRGNGIVVPGWGFLLNNELTDFNFDSLTTTRTGPTAASARAAR